MKLKQKRYAVCRSSDTNKTIVNIKISHDTGTIIYYAFAFAVNERVLELPISMTTA